MKQQDPAQKLADNLETLIVNFKAIDDTCVELSEDLSTRELNLVVWVGDSGEVIMKEISDMMNVPMSTATGIVDKLVQKGYLKRKHSERDRRTVQIELATKGIEARDLFKRLKKQMTSHIIEILSQDESAQLLQLLEKITAGLHDYLLTGQAEPV